MHFKNPSFKKKKTNTKKHPSLVDVGEKAVQESSLPCTAGTWRHGKAQAAPCRAVVPSRAHQHGAPGAGARLLRPRDPNGFLSEASDCIRAAPSTAPAEMTWFPFRFAPSLCDIQTMAVRHSGSLSTCQDVFLPAQKLGEVRYLLQRFLMFAAHVFYLTNENYDYFKAAIKFFL